MQEYVKPVFVSRDIFPGDYSWCCLHEFLAAVAETHLDVLVVYNDRHTCFLACRAPAENPAASREEIVRRWGEALYRRFRLHTRG